jgi:hypothetical protein
MTPTQKRNISNGVRLAFQRKRRSLAMKQSWERRRADALTTSRNNSTPSGVQHSLDTQISTSTLDSFDAIEQLCHLWKGLETERTWTASNSQCQTIIDTAVTLTRLEIILVCREYLGDNDK